MTTVTVGIPAHNESRNIARLLDSVLNQESQRFTLERIIVACDGCTDNTADIVRAYTKRYPIVELLDDGERLGQGGRLNNFYKLSTSDVFVTFDADTVLGDHFVIDRLVAAFRSQDIGLVGGRGVPMAARGFWESVFISWIEIWYRVRKDFNGGDTVHNHEGCISAMSRAFYEKITIPKEVVGTDEYLYFQAKTLGFSFVFVPEATTLYRCPATLADYKRQSSRFHETKYFLAHLFAFDILAEYRLPASKKIEALSTVFLRHPIKVFLAVLIQLELRFSKPDTGLSNSSGIWQTVESTK